MGIKDFFSPPPVEQDPEPEPVMVDEPELVEPVEDIVLALGPVRQAQPKPGGATSKYRVLGVWSEDGSWSKLRTLHIEVQGHDQVYGIDSVMELTRLEASVLGKRYALSMVNQ